MQGRTFQKALPTWPQPPTAPVQVLDEPSFSCLCLVPTLLDCEHHYKEIQLYGECMEDAAHSEVAPGRVG